MSKILWLILGVVFFCGVVLGAAVLMKRDFFQICRTGTPAQVRAAISTVDDIHTRNKYGMTGLMWAAGGNPDPEVTRLLLKAGLEIDARDANGRTALLYAAWKNSNSEVVAALLEGGADISVRDETGKSALDYARDNAALRGSPVLRGLESR